MEFNTTEEIDQFPNYVKLIDVLKSNENYLFPSHLNGIENKSKLIMALRICAMKAGFWLALRTSKCESQSKEASPCLSYNAMSTWNQILSKFE